MRAISQDSLFYFFIYANIQQVSQKFVPNENTLEAEGKLTRPINLVEICVWFPFVLTIFEAVCLLNVMRLSWSPGNRSLASLFSPIPSGLQILRELEYKKERSLI